MVSKIESIIKSIFVMSSFFLAGITNINASMTQKTEDNICVTKALNLLAKIVKLFPESEEKEKVDFFILS